MVRPAVYNLQRTIELEKLFAVLRLYKNKEEASKSKKVLH